MRVLTLEVKLLQSVQDVIKLLREQQIEKGDTLHVIIESKPGFMATATVMMITVAIKYIITGGEPSGTMLDKLLSVKTTEEIGKYVREEYGIIITVEEEKENEEEPQPGRVSNRYGNNDPDDRSIPLLEPDSKYDTPSN